MAESTTMLATTSVIRLEAFFFPVKGYTSDASRGEESEAHHWETPCSGKKAR